MTVQPAHVAGIHCVLFAFFDAQGALDRGAMRAQMLAVRAMGVDGIVVLGLATEVGKLSLAEKHTLIDWTTEDVGTLPLTATITGNSVAEQVELGRHAADAGSLLAILQPPSGGVANGDALLDFFAEVGAQLPIDLSIQNAPQYLGRGISAADVMALRQRLPRLTHIKAELPAVDLAAFIAAQPDSVTVLNGRGGLEMTDCLRAGARGFIVAPDVAPGTLAIWRAWQAGRETEADALYADFLPAATFGMQSLDHLATYGKRIFARRAGLTVHDRTPGLAPTPFGLSLVERYAGNRP
ncbi:MAG: dihydrodipicolinate synthase family protein [Devosia sp.]